MRIERMVPCSPKELWARLIQNAEATDRGALLRLELACGLPEIAAQITRYKSQQLLECCWGGKRLRWELAPHGDGMTLLAFTYAPDNDRWLGCLDSITAFLGLDPVETKVAPGIQRRVIREKGIKGE